MEIDFVPGVIYGENDDKQNLKILVQVNRIEFEQQLRAKGASIENTIYNIKLDNGETYPVVPRQIQFNPCKSFFPSPYPVPSLIPLHATTRAAPQ